MFQFTYPQFLWLLILIPILIGLYFFLEKSKHRKAVFFSQLRLFDFFRKKQERNRYIQLTLFGLRLIIIALLVLALSAPYISFQKEITTKSGIDIFLTLDVSLSMNAEDLEPNRLQAAKETAKDFIDTLETDRLGIIIFAGKALTEAPLTFDYGIIKEIINDISLREYDKTRPDLEGTAIGTAIAAAITKLEQSEPERTKVIILLTDGEANKGIDPIVAAKYAAEKSMKIYTIGLGTEEGVLIPITKEFGKPLYARQQDGSLQKTYLDIKSLQNIAKIANGKFFQASNKEELSDIYREISKLEKSELEVEIIEAKSSKAYLLLIIALVLFIIEIILNHTRYYIHR